jgi:hypothetical protein
VNGELRQETDRGRDDHRTGGLFSRQARNPAYLKAGDLITASVATPDGAIDLGTQRTVVRDAQF